MFLSLKPILDTCVSVTVVLSAINADGTVTVTVVPKAKEGQEASLSTPLSLTATLEELDAEFASVILSYVTKRTSLSEQLEATQTILDAAKQDAAKKVAESKGKKSLPAPSVNSVSGDDGDGDDDEGGGCCSAQVTSAPPIATASDDLWS